MSVIIVTTVTIAVTITASFNQAYDDDTVIDSSRAVVSCGENTSTVESPAVIASSDCNCHWAILDCILHGSSASLVLPAFS